jgi:hypothetical protein
VADVECHARLEERLLLLVADVQCHAQLEERLLLLVADVQCHGSRNGQCYLQLSFLDFCYDPLWN